MAESAPEHPSMQTLLGSSDAEILKVAEKSLQGRTCSCAKCSPQQITGNVHEGAVPRTCQMHGQGWSTEQGWVS